MFFLAVADGQDAERVKNSLRVRSETSAHEAETRDSLVRGASQKAANVAGVSGLAGDESASGSSGVPKSPKTAKDHWQIAADRWGGKNAWTDSVRTWFRLANDIPAPSYTASYWESRYLAERGVFFDWYCDYHRLKPILSAAFGRLRGIALATSGSTPMDDPGSKDHLEILLLGSGSSELPFQMYADGYKNITAVDNCEVVVEMMTRKILNRESSGVGAAQYDDKKRNNTNGMMNTTGRDGSTASSNKLQGDGIMTDSVEFLHFDFDQEAMARLREEKESGKRKQGLSPSLGGPLQLTGNQLKTWSFFPAQAFSCVIDKATLDVHEAKFLEQTEQDMYMALAQRKTRQRDRPGEKRSGDAATGNFGDDAVVGGSILDASDRQGAGITAEEVRKLGLDVLEARDAHMQGLVQQIVRVLKPGGFFLSLSVYPPEERVKQYLTLNGTASWKVDVTRVLRSNVPFLQGAGIDHNYYCYVCTMPLV